MYGLLGGEQSVLRSSLNLKRSSHSFNRLVGLCCLRAETPVFSRWMVASGGIPGPLAVLAQKVRKVVLRPRFLKVQLKVVIQALWCRFFTLCRLHTCTGKSAHTRGSQVIGKVGSDRVIH